MKYVVAAGVCYTHKGKDYVEGDEISEEIFNPKKVFKEAIKAGKIIAVKGTPDKPTDGNGDSGKPVDGSTDAGASDDEKPVDGSTDTGASDDGKPVDGSADAGTDNAGSTDDKKGGK